MKLAFHDKIAGVLEIDISTDELISALLRLSENEPVCILDSCGVRHLGSHLLIAGIEPVEVVEISRENVDQTLSILDNKLGGGSAAIFTISYDFGLRLQGFDPSELRPPARPEPDVCISLFNSLIIHDYDTGITGLVGDESTFESIRQKFGIRMEPRHSYLPNGRTKISSNFTKENYVSAIGTIKAFIRAGDTYQTNLTRQITATLPSEMTEQLVFEQLRRVHPAPFAAFIKRRDSAVISASPERFFRVNVDRRTISTSPIKGTRRRGPTPEDDDRIRRELLSSPKDRAENTMIVDLLRNDLGRVCEYGSVRVEKLCDLEEHPTLFHLVSTVNGDLRSGVTFSEVLKAVFPCGSVTGAPKISTMRIIDEIEPVNRGLSMGAIGYYFPGKARSRDFGRWASDTIYDLSVAIRTMVFRDQACTFNVGGGILIDSDPAAEYDETITKAAALLAALDAPAEFNL